jgi:hypothetical protein
METAPVWGCRFARSLCLCPALSEQGLSHRQLSTRQSVALHGCSFLSPSVLCPRDIVSGSCGRKRNQRHLLGPAWRRHWPASQETIDRCWCVVARCRHWIGACVRRSRLWHDLRQSVELPATLRGVAGIPTRPCSGPPRRRRSQILLSLPGAEEGETSLRSTAPLARGLRHHLLLDLLGLNAHPVGIIPRSVGPVVGGNCE